MTGPLAHRVAPVQLWLGCGWVLASWALWQGITYTGTGNNQVHTPALYVAAHEIPGGMRTHGVIMIALAFLLVYYLRVPNAFTIRVLDLFAAYSTWVALTVIGSWWVTGQITIGAPSYWLAFAAIALLMGRYPPHDDDDRGRDA